MESPVLRRGRPRGEFYICPLVLTRALFERMCISERIGKYDHCLIILRLSGSVKLAVVSHPSRGLWSYSECVGGFQARIVRLLVGMFLPVDTFQSSPCVPDTQQDAVRHY